MPNNRQSYDSTTVNGYDDGISELEIRSLFEDLQIQFRELQARVEELESTIRLEGLDNPWSE